MQKLVMFDLDGTLLSSGMSGKKALDKAMQNLYGKTPEYDLTILNGNTDSKNFAAVFEITVGRKIKPAELAALKTEYLRCLPAEVKTCVSAGSHKLIKGIVKFLDFLQKQKNVYLALGTGNFRSAAFIKLKPCGLEKYFQTGGFGEDSANRTQMLARGVKHAEKHFKTKFAPEQVFIIGDTHKDVIAAKENGFHSGVVVGSDYSDKRRLTRAAAELEMPDFTDIKTWCVWLDIKADPKGVKRGSYIMPASAIEHVFFSRTGIDEDRLKRFRIKKYENLPTGKIF